MGTFKMNSADGTIHFNSSFFCKNSIYLGFITTPQNGEVKALSVSVP